MPELPEVEVIRRRIEPFLVGRRIQAVRTTRDSYVFLTRPARLRRGLAGRTVRTLERRGKYLVANLDEGSRLVVHLGMTGQLFCDTAVSARLLPPRARDGCAYHLARSFCPDLHTHLRFEFEDRGPNVYLRDVRKLGKVLLLPDGASHPRLDRLGVDALHATGELLWSATRGRSVAIKSLLLDQGVMAGVGNIYADEALFLAGVRPSRRAGRVTRLECERIARALHSVLEESIRTGGSSVSDFVAPDGCDGDYQDAHRVYGRAGQPCSGCGARVRRTVIGQRGTHYCPRCQR